MFPQTLRSALRFRVPVRILFLVGAAVLLAIGAPALISSAAPPAAQEKGIARARNSSHAMLSSTGWSALDFGVNAGIAAVAASTTHVYVSGGTLTQVCGNVTCNSGNTTTRGIARWDGNNWSPLGDGVNGGVTAIAVSGSDVYAGGKFTQVCPDAACSPGGTTVNILPSGANCGFV